MKLFKEASKLGSFNTSKLLFRMFHIMN